MRDPTYLCHRNCTYILPGRSIPDAKQKWLREKTHGCWCSSWKMTENGLRIWKNGRWSKPSKGELRHSKNPPRG